MIVFGKVFIIAGGILWLISLLATKKSDDINIVIINWLSPVMIAIGVITLLQYSSWFDPLNWLGLIGSIVCLSGLLGFLNSIAEIYIKIDNGDDNRLRIYVPVIIGVIGLVIIGISFEL